jgi:general secretion pathway protein K
MWWKVKVSQYRPRASGGGALPRDEGGAILLLVILILALLSLVILSWAREWRTELKLAENYREACQCRCLAEAGVYYALGKLVILKVAEMSQAAASPDSAPLADIWWADQRPHLLELPGGWAEVRVEDEAGKINLNTAPEETLTNLFAVLGFAGPRRRIMVDSLLDWRSRGEQSRAFGAKSDYYLGLDPPYVAKNGRFDVVEELAWVRGFEGLALLPRLGEWLTVAGGGGAINLNTAPLEVLRASGFPFDLAYTLVLRRQGAPLRRLQDIPQFSSGQFRQPYIFQSSPFFTIKSTGMVKKKGARHTIKAVVQINLGAQNIWEIQSWVDDFPG